MAAVKKEYSMDEFEAKYHEITALYVFADDLVGTVKDKSVSNKQAQYDLVEPLLNEIADAADILSEEFILAAESKKNRSASKSSKAHVELAIRKIFAALNEYHARVKAVKNVADGIVKKIQLQVDKIIAIFLEFVQISLQSIMNKAELDALKARDARIALMMHQLSLAQHGG